MPISETCAVWGLILLLASVHSVRATIGCLNANDEPVDWWVILKAPLGARYGYIDSTMTRNKFTEPTTDLSLPHDNPLADTLQQIFGPSGSGSPDGVGYVIWNDDPGVRSPAVKRKINADFHAHSKGVLGFQEDGGFYLLHSTPNFPDNPATSEYQGISNCGKTKCGDKSGQFEYGQSYLCMTLDAHNMDTVAQVLRGDYLVVYGAKDDGVANDMPNVASFVQQDFSGLPATVSGVPFQTVAGETFLMFGMAPSEPQYPVYLYEELIETKLGAGLQVQTWTESPRFPSYCPNGCEPPGYNFSETINVKKIKITADIPEWRAENIAKGQGQQDHSKWAITIPGRNSVKVLCIADINRAGHQLIRGGGAACFMNNPAMWKLFSSIITDTEACQSTCPVEAPKKTRPKHTVKPGMRGHPEKKDAEHQHRRHDVDEGL